jgi:hypothetical protein
MELVTTGLGTGLIGIGTGDVLCSDITLLKLLIYKNARQTNPSFAGNE